MLLSLGFIFLLGVIFDYISKRINIPSLLSYIVIGIIIGPSVLNILDKSLLNMSSDIRSIILIIILSRAGLSLNLSELKKVSKTALLLSFLPATFEIIGVVILSMLLFNISLSESLLLGSVLAAVSPAVVAPRMINLISKKRGIKKGIPQFILAGASIDDIYALILFSSFLALNQSSKFNFLTLLNIPLSIISGIFIGVILGYLFSLLFKVIKVNSIYQMLILLSISFLLNYIENTYNLIFSSILSVMSMMIIINQNLPSDSVKVSHIYNQMWIVGEIILFTLVGTSINLSYVYSAGLLAFILIILALAFRMLGVYFSINKTNLNFKEKLFTLIAYTPKATVQAAIGAIPLSLGLSVGELILTISTLSILISAPLGALGIDKSYKYLLSDDN